MKALSKETSLTIEQVLEAYKKGEATLEEARNEIEVLIADRKIEKDIEWQDDDCIRIAVFRGRRLIRHGYRDNVQCDITYSGDPLNVYCDHSLTVKGNVVGSAKAGHSLTCAGSVGGDTFAGHSLSCGDVKQNVKAGHGVNCHNVGGDITAGHGVTIAGKRG